MRLVCARLESFQKLRVVSEGSNNGDRSELAFNLCSGPALLELVEPLNPKPKP